MIRQKCPSPANFIAPALLAMVALAGSPLLAHVILEAPNGGETLLVGQEIVIEWRVGVVHNTQNWDLWYSITGENGPWLPIALDLPVGDPTAGSVHTFVWNVPIDPSQQVRVRVRQDNAGLDYEDVSDSDLTIATSDIFVDGFESGDFGAWSVVEGETPPASSSP